MKIIEQYIIQETIAEKTLAIPENWDIVETGPVTAKTKESKNKYDWVFYEGGNDWEPAYKYLAVFAQKKFKLMPLLQQVSSNKWTETYYKEDPTILTAQGTRNIKEIGRLSEFPTVERSWTKVSANHS